jgi:hypothetical protein
MVEGSDGKYAKGGRVKRERKPNGKCDAQSERKRSMLMHIIEERLDGKP